MENVDVSQILTYGKAAKGFGKFAKGLSGDSKKGLKEASKQLPVLPFTDGHRRKSHSSSSSSSSSSSPSRSRAAKQKSGKKGAASHIKNKARDSSTSDDDKNIAKNVLGAINVKNKLPGVTSLPISKQGFGKFAKALSGDSTKGLKEASKLLPDSPFTDGHRRKSHSSSSSSSPSRSRAAKQKSGMKGAASSEHGLLSHIKSKARDSSTSDDDKKNAKDVLGAVNVKNKLHGLKSLPISMKGIEKIAKTTELDSKKGIKTLTKQLSESTFTDGLRRKSRSSSSSSRSPSRSRAAKQNSGKKGAASSIGGLLSGSKSNSGKSSTSGKDQDGYDKTFARDVRAAVNGKRKIHGVKKLSKSRKLNKAAEQWARHLAAMDKMEHKEDKDIGQNVYRFVANLPTTKSQLTGGQVVEQWYSQKNKHKFGEEPAYGPLENGHFTQMVWKDSKKLGVGIAINANKHNIYVVAFFTPKGNCKGLFATQVLTER